MYCCVPLHVGPAWTLHGDVFPGRASYAQDGQRVRCLDVGEPASSGNGDATCKEVMTAWAREFVCFACLLSEFVARCAPWPGERRSVLASRVFLYGAYSVQRYIILQTRCGGVVLVVVLVHVHTQKSASAIWAAPSPARRVSISFLFSSLFPFSGALLGTPCQHWPWRVSQT